jgi:hypothetical protein
VDCGNKWVVAACLASPRQALKLGRWPASDGIISTGNSAVRRPADGYEIQGTNHACS